MVNEIHIASMIVHVHPPQLPDLLAHVANRPALEVRAQSPSGKVVLVAESEWQKAILAEIDGLEQCKGVLSCTMVYHEVMDGAKADEVLATVNPSTPPEEVSQILHIKTGATL